MLEIQGDKQVESLRLSGPENQRSSMWLGYSLRWDSSRNAMVFSPLELNEYGYVKAGEDCATNVPGVFVAGGQPVQGARQLVTAAADGAMAASKAGSISARAVKADLRKPAKKA